MEKSSDKVHVSTKRLRWHRKNVSVAQAAGDRNLFVPLVARVLYRHLEQELSALGEPGILALDFSEVAFVDSSSLLASIGRLLFWNIENDWHKSIVLENTTKTQREALAVVLAIWPENQESHSRRILTVTSCREDGTWEMVGELNETESLLWKIAKEGEISLDDFVSRSGLERESVLSNLQTLTENRLLWTSNQDGVTYITPIQTLLHEDKVSKPLSINNIKISILFIAADPTDASRLRLGQEFREIQEKLKLAQLRDRFELALPQLSVRPADISQALLDVHPQIVHFSGHGASTGALCFENQVGQTHFVQPDALASLFEQFAHQTNCVLLNACYSEIQAKAIGEHIKYVVGMNQSIGDFQNFNHSKDMID